MPTSLRSHSILRASLALLLVAGACDKTDPAPSKTPSTTATPTTVPGGSAAPAASGAPATPSAPAAPAVPDLVVAAEGAACPAGTQALTDTPVTLDGGKLSFERRRSGGCHTRPVYTVLYTKGDPTQLRVCSDADADMCEAIVRDKVAFDLAAVLAAAGAKTATLAK